MISTTLLQEAVIAKLKASAAVVALVDSDEIREISHVALDAKSLPALRVGCGELTPTSNNCRDIHTDASVLVQVYEESDTSHEGANLARVVTQALWQRRLTTASIKTSALIPLRLSAPLRMGDRLWFSEVLFKCIAIEL